MMMMMMKRMRMLKLNMLMLMTQMMMRMLAFAALARHPTASHIGMKFSVEKPVAFASSTSCWQSSAVISSSTLRILGMMRAACMDSCVARASGDLRAALARAGGYAECVDPLGASGLQRLCR